MGPWAVLSRHKILDPFLRELAQPPPRHDAGPLLLAHRPADLPPHLSSLVLVSTTAIAFTTAFTTA